MYQVIYSSVVIWCAILTWLFMKRSLSIMQWIAIFGTSTGLAISSMGNFSSSAQVDEQSAAKTTLLMFGTLMTLGGTFFYCKFDKIICDFLLLLIIHIKHSLRICLFRLHHEPTKASTITC